MSPHSDVKVMLSVSSDTSSCESVEGPESCQARDETFELRNQVAELRGRLDDAEDERKFHAAVAKELKDTVRAFQEDQAHDELVNKSLRLAELSMDMEAKEGWNKVLELEIATIQESLLLEKKKMNEVAMYVRSICRSKGKDKDTGGDDILRALKSHMQKMEKERQGLLAKCAAQEKTILTLQEDNHTKHERLRVLEENFCSLNRQRLDEAGALTQSQDDDATKKEVPEQSPQEPASPEVPRELQRRQLSLRRLLWSPRTTHQGTTEAETTPTKTDETKMDPPQSPDELTAASSTASPASSDENDEEVPEFRKHRSLCILMEGGRTRRERPEALSPSTRSHSSRVLKVDEEPLSPPSSRKQTVKVTISGLVGVYSGPLIDGKPNGVGTVRFSNGTTYLGALVDGKFHGRGTLYGKDGFSRGFFQDNEFIG